MAAKTFLKRVKLELPIRLRKKTRHSKIENEKPMTICTNCRCKDFEDWFECHDKK
jgi:hypothetical protein